MMMSIRGASRIALPAMRRRTGGARCETRVSVVDGNLSFGET
jgi:hypothetical protein